MPARKYRVGLVGLGVTGWLTDVADLSAMNRDKPGMPPLREDRDPPPWAHPGKEGLPDGFADGIRLNPNLELVAGCDGDEERLAAFGQRYGVTGLYTDYREMLRREKLDIVGVPTRVKIRPEVTLAAVEAGARGIMTEKPIAYTLAEADAMVEACDRAGVPLMVGKISVTHPAFLQAKRLIEDGEIGRVLSLDAAGCSGQHNTWTYLVDSDADWVIDGGNAEAGPDEEYHGSGGLIHFANGICGHMRQGAPELRITGESGEILWTQMSISNGLRLFKDVEVQGKRQRLEVAWPGPNIISVWSTVYCFQELVECMENGTEPRVSGRRVRRAMEIQIALRESRRQGNVRVDLPLKDRSLGMFYPSR